MKKVKRYFAILLGLLVLTGCSSKAPNEQHISATSTLYTTANTSLMANINADSPQERLENLIGSEDLGVKSLKGSINGEIYWDGVTLYLDEEYKECIAVSYEVDGIMVVNPEEYTTTDSNGKTIVNTSAFPTQNFIPVTFN